MYGKVIVVAAMIAAITTAGVAGPVDNASNASQFEGVWSGQWDSGQDVTITIGQKNRTGANKVTYEYGWTKFGSGAPVPPGSFVAYGRERDGVFTFGWKNKEGQKRIVTLKKFEGNENVAKARFELVGSTTTIQKPYYDAMLKRK